MKRSLKYTFIVLLIGSTVMSCNDGFEDINVSPNNPAEPNTALLITSAIRALGSQTQGIAGWAKDLYPQYTAEIQYTSESRFQNKIYSYYPIYNGPLLDLQTVINLNTDPETASEPYVLVGGSNSNQIGVSRILKSFYFLHITDRWGMAPYAEALQGIENLSPKFDTQEEIYNGIFAELKEAVGQLNDDEELNGDILFDGDVAKWRKWANTIRMVAALHLSKVDPAWAEAEFTDAYASGVMESNSDNAVFHYLADANNQSPIYNNYEAGQRYDYAVSEQMVNTLVDLDDPRLAVYARPTDTDGSYVGMPYGLIQGETGDYSRENVSLVGDVFSAQDADLPITTYAQTQFMLAEAAVLGWIPGGDATASTHYEAGVTASLAVLGLQSEAPSYLAGSNVAYDASNALELIITQKWIAGFLGNGYETWADWRRTGLPELDPGPAPLNTNGDLPRRQAYTTEEAGRNPANYQAAIAAQGDDELYVRVWWDVD